VEEVGSVGAVEVMVRLLVSLGMPNVGHVRELANAQLATGLAKYFDRLLTKTVGG
jgi:hypothetical protein